MSEVTFACPRCARRIRVLASFVGGQGKCPGCRDLLVVPADGAEVPPPPPVDDAPGDADDDAIAVAAHRPCPLCGEPIRAQAKKCRHCGEFLDEALRRRMRHATGEVRLAPRGARFAAYVVDAWLLNLPTIALLVLLVNVKGGGEPLVALALLWYCALALIQWHRITVSGQTIGKRWLGIRIVRLDGSLPGFVQGVILRNWIYFIVGNPVLTWIALLFRFIDGVMIFGDDRRCLRDWLASTRVVVAEEAAPDA
ncbi:MAG: RDD family protein [Planctomycetes bacterium]|nr:RDD family protein [Planctomycetota bacterium]